ncbi:transmembrane protein, putative [Medicago truncatula]|uniref:Transmembrane protein, putative n=1 Tax=Medicago truncatula TaxID=3880 RepID=G7IKB7_MEDTR|nr:transmembrane protein, putative [Medicago truncatula]
MDDAAKLSTNLLPTRGKVALVIFIVTEGQYGISSTYILLKIKIIGMFVAPFAYCWQVRGVFVSSLTNLLVEIPVLSTGKVMSLYYEVHEQC